MDIKQLRRFVAVAELGSFNKASELLALSQPSLTRSIQQLEETVGALLFDRGARGITLTAVGEEFLPHARIILHERDRAMEMVHGILGLRAAAITLGSEAAFAMHRLPRALATMAQRHPEVRLSVTEGALNDMLDAVREGRMAFALGSHAPYLDYRDLSFEPLCTEEASVILRAGHPLLAGLADGAQPDLALLATGRWIVAENPIVLEGWAGMFARAGVAVPEVALRTSSLVLTKGCLLHGDCISLGDITAFEDEIASGRLLRLDFGQPSYSRPAGIFHRVGAKLSRNERDFVHVLRSAFA